MFHNSDINQHTFSASDAIPFCHNVLSEPKTIVLQAFEVKFCMRPKSGRKISAGILSSDPINCSITRSFFIVISFDGLLILTGGLVFRSIVVTAALE